MHCIISTVVVGFEINYLILSYLILQSPWSRLCCIRLSTFVIITLHYIKAMRYQTKSHIDFPEFYWKKTYIIYKLNAVENDKFANSLTTLTVYSVGGNVQLEKQNIRTQYNVTTHEQSVAYRPYKNTDWKPGRNESLILAHCMNWGSGYTSGYVHISSSTRRKRN